MSWLNRLWRGREVEVTQRHEVVLPGLGRVLVTRSADCFGTACPRPQLLTMQMVEELAEGEIFELLSDNPTSVDTIPALAMVLCSTHLATVRDEKGWRIYIRKGL